ncbi:MAG: two component, sigma54 specific, transcriptional regulator, Fis family [Candidatus Acidoferrum typicum]|nr:two component, sigma54 specific, transcriptional regulator, Fis family [Candidatus Acidoferrum typicum]
MYERWHNGGPAGRAAARNSVNTRHEKAAILVVEDETKMRRLLELQLGEEGFVVHSAADAETGLQLLLREKPDLVVTDLRLPGMSGLEFLQAVKRVNAALPVVVMTAYGTVESAVEAMKVGASDYVTKPFSLAELVLVIRKELDSHRLREENRSLREALGHRYAYDNIVAQSDKMQAVLALVERVAPTSSTVLLGGESGVGKDLIARAIHEHSQRASGPFVKINSTAIPETLLESELFGYEKGAFSGAAGTKQGKFELADKGTLFLDEIGDVPAAIQVKLLRVLQDREFERLGGTKTHRVDVRLVAATNRDLRAALEEGTFREDLYYRLNVVAIDIPPLRDHKEDIPALANYFIERYARESAKPVTGITPEAMKRLMDYHWPGNVRELQNIIERGVTLYSANSSGTPAGSMLDAADIYLDDSAMRSATNSTHVLPPGMTLEQWEDETIREALRRANGNKSQAARTLGLSRNALRYRLSKLGVHDPEVKES